MFLKHVPEDGRILRRLYREAVRHLQENLMTSCRGNSRNIMRQYDIEAF